MTDPAIIAASYAAERNYSHNLDDVIDSSDAVGAWGTTKESTTKLTDLSGNENTGTINGCMPSSGFFLGRRFDGDDDIISLPKLQLVGGSSFTVYASVRIGVLGTSQTILSEGVGTNTASDGFHLYILSSNAIFFTVGNGSAGVEAVYDLDVIDVSVGDIINIIGVYDNDTTLAKLYINGVLYDTSSALQGGYSTYSAKPPLIGRLAYTSAYFWSGIIDNVCVLNRSISTYEAEMHFNTLAVLPFWSINYQDYPDNVTEYTDNLPYSSSIINSGTFKVDDDKLQCVSAGTMTYSASYNFDGSEYITATIDGVEYAGTGTITQGNTTVGVAQGSNKVTIVMGTGDTIGGIGIQFRNTV